MPDCVTVWYKKGTTKKATLNKQNIVNIKIIGVKTLRKDDT